MSVLPERLKAAYSLVPECEVFLDIGTDHGFLPIELVRGGIAKRAIAADIGKGPLSRAEEHIRSAGLEDRITTRLSDGLKAFRPGEADTAGILGMGGATIRKILSEGDPKGKGIKTLVLGPQSEVPNLRSFLLSEGFRIREERLVFEDGKYYFLMRVDTKPEEREEPYSEEELLIGRRILSKPDETLRSYLAWREKTLLDIRKNLGRAVSAAEREAEVRSELELIQRIKSDVF